MFGSYRGALLPGLHVVEGGQTSTGGAVAWLRGRVLNAGLGAGAAAGAGEEATGAAPAADAAGPSSSNAGGGFSYAQLDALAAAIAPGSDGVVVLDHFQGNRTPHTDPFSRGVLGGLTLATGPGHLHRALLEGICFGTEAVLEAMRAAGFCPAALSVAGGATRSPLWLQMHADVSGLPLSVPAGASDAPALGCAILAAAAAGFHGGDIVRAARAMVRVDRALTPDPERSRQYAPAYARWKTLYPALRATFHPGSGTGAGGGGGGGDAAAAASIGALPLVAAALESRVAVAPSLLAADFANPAADLARLEEGWPTDGGGGGEDGAAASGAGAPWSTRRWLHFDMFDGSLNTQITFGCPLLERLRPLTRRLVDVHLIAREPLRHFEQLRQAGADAVTVQFENIVVGAAAGPEAGAAGGAGAGAGGEGGGLSRLREVCAEATRVFGSAGVALALGTPAEALAPLLSPTPEQQEGAGAPPIARALVMAVRLGFGGLKFQRDETLAKVRALREMGGERLVIVVDGGIGPDEAAACAEAGANVLVAGSSVFRAKGGVAPGDAERAVLRAAAEGAAARRLQEAVVAA
jgi:pentose-5-phosphate-3-epimerase